MTQAARIRPLLADEDAQALNTLLFEVLVGAGTTVWAWDAVSDQLGGINCSVEMLGYAPGQVPWTQAGWDALIHPHDRSGAEQAYAHHLRGDSDRYECEYRALAADGRWRWLAERGQIVAWQAPGVARRVVGTLADIGPRKRAEDQASAMRDRLAQLASHVPGMLYQYTGGGDGVGRFLYASEGCLALLGCTPQALIDDASIPLQLIARNELARLGASLRRSADTLQPWRDSFRIFPRGQAARWVQVEATPRRETAADGQSEVTWHGYLQDITERRALDLAREDAAASAAANRAKTEFLSRVSHELRTPLNAVLGFAQLMEIDRRDPLSDNQRRRMHLIHDAGDHLLRMIGDLLDLTRIEAGHMLVDARPVPLAALVHDCADMLGLVAQSAGVAMTLPPIDLALTAWADPGRLKQVLLNLLSNALKYNRAGGQVTVGLATTGRGVSIVVADTGQGIAAEHMPKLFEPFNRLGRQGGDIEGTGIGLAVTRALVDLMQGSIEVSSRVGVGSVFTVRLPHTPPPPPSPPSSAGEAAAQVPSLPM